MASVRLELCGARYLRPQLPVMLLLILRPLANKLRRRLSRCQTKARDVAKIFRLNAKAEGEEVVIGGWLSLGNSRM